MVNAEYITDTEQVVAIVRKEIAEFGWASEVEFDFDGDHICGSVSTVTETNGTIELFGKEYSASEFTVTLDEITNLTIFARPI